MKTFGKFLSILMVLAGAVNAHAEGSIQEGIGSSEVRWNKSFFSLMNTELKNSSEGGARLSSYNYFTFARRYSTDSKFALRIPFQYNTAGFDNFHGNTPQPQEMFLQDIFVSWVDYNLILLPFDIGTYWEGRVYVPTSSNSKDTKLIVRYRNDFIFSKYFSNRWSLEYISKFNYYQQSQKAYRNDFVGSDGFDVSTVSATKQFYHDHWLQLWYTIGGGSQVGWRYGWEDTTYNQSKLENVNKAALHEIKTGPSYAFELNQNANFILNLSEVVNNATSRKDQFKFKQENLMLTLLAFVRI